MAKLNEDINIRRGIIVSPEDRILLIRYRFAVNAAGYCYTKTEGKNVFLHKILLSEPNTIVDHVNGNKLDNRRENLRYATASQNSHNCKLSSDNTTGYKGVTKRHNGTFQAYINVNGKRENLGTYLTAVEAAKVYDKASEKYHKEFSSHNGTT